ncbi:hypothetical protein PVAND_000917 [Polypedilum vanderplanki]|uniref:BTB domain-containing protein n=1 Tax=Polypedilum vanderplanki TaxID=319348 RepID=A0A9J6BLN6_POLVA|nr:hypothetical protein PVAND_000917 [Polypedilum vanderplanki]
MKQQINCQMKHDRYPFYKNSKWIYTCYIENQKINANAEIEMIGLHKQGLLNKNVFIVILENCKLSRIPQGLKSIFPNMEVLQIVKSNLPHIDRKDLKEYETLKQFYFCFNPIRFLLDDLLLDMKSLEFFTVRGSMLEFVEPNILNGLSKLKYANFNECGFMNLRFNSIQPEANDVSLEELKDELHSKYEDYVRKKMLDNKQQQMLNDFEFIFNLKRVMQNENFKDFKVVVGLEEFKVHKFVLAACSPVFAEMIENNTEAESLKLVDIPPEIFCVIYNYIYLKKFPNPRNCNLIHLLVACKRLKIKKLAEFAAKELENVINLENAIELLALGNKYGYEDLKRKSFVKVKEIFEK